MKTNMCSARRQCQLIQSIYCTNEETQEDLQALRKPNIVTEVPSWCSWANHWSHLKFWHHCLRKQQYLAKVVTFLRVGLAGSLNKWQCLDLWRKTKVEASWLKSIFGSDFLRLQLEEVCIQYFKNSTNRELECKKSMPLKTFSYKIDLVKWPYYIFGTIYR